jgi:hypothetical protein
MAETKIRITLVCTLCLFKYNADVHIMYCIPAVLPPVVLHEMGNKVTERKGEGEKYTVKWEWNKRHRKRDIN